MNKSSVILTVLLTLCAACGSKSSDQASAGGDSQSSTTDLGSAETISQGKVLINANDCMTCHDLQVKRIGPAQDSIAAKYEFTKANVDMLAKKVIDGGSGNWGTIPMTPHADLPMENAQKMVAYILSLDGEHLH